MQIGVQPSEVAKLTLPMIIALTDTNGEVVTLRDARLLERFFASGQ